MAEPLQILLFDLETAPLLAHVWRPDDAYIPHERMIHDSFLLCWGAKWRHQKTVMTGVLTPKEAVAQDDTRIVKELADLIREADIVVAHNADRFDVPMFNNRLLLLGLEPLGPVRTLDTLTLARKNFRLSHNSLDYLGQALGLGSKVKTDFALWRRCYQGELSALERMRAYNRRDVVLLGQVFERLLPYVKNLPRLVEGSHRGEMSCPSCGSGDVIKRGFFRTQASTFQKVQCVFCGRYSRYRTSEPVNKLGLTPL